MDGNKLQSIPKPILYLLLILVTTIPLFADLSVPNKPQDAAIDLYAELMKLEPGSTILVASDWTGSTRGESKGAFRAIMKILMRRGVKVAFYSSADPQAPRVYQDAIAELNVERQAEGDKPYERWNDWVNVGFFPNAEAATNGISQDLKGAFAGRKDFPPGSVPKDVFASPVLAGKEKVEDFKMLLVITASKTSNITVERIYGKTPLAFAVTGVMVPETQVFYQAKQLVGFSGGLKGVLDLETLLETGVNYPDKATAKVKSEKYDTIEGFPGKKNKGQGTKYYPTLHFALAFMILLVIVGNVGMIMSKRQAAAGGAK
jgi:hypothetical protein